ncbi:MAG: flagellar hook-associated protein FlgL, partial [Lachnospiraceae bacterium]|nr:flagellar hook-associated protein FlgL [Lachnospiraceae bacterium]
MRITNKMMNNNTLRNINSNKEYLDKLNNQMASGKKIVRPSDDPVTAIRALKLRSNLSEITQYYDRNTNDANAWLQATQDAVESTKEILTSMKSKFTTGATGTNTVESRNAILSELQALSKQIYDDGNADYAGRSLFTGYRTSTDLVVQDEDLKGNTFAYKGITETFSKA